MRIAVVGATGLVGKPIVEALESQGHEVRRLHRSSSAHPVDLRSGAGLESALAGVDVVVNAANSPPWSAGPVLVKGTATLLAASEAHHVCVSIVGLEAAAPFYGYYRRKLEQERLVMGSGRPYSIVRATQFHEFVGAFMLALGRFRIALRSDALVSPVAAGEVAAVIARTATGEPTRATRTVCGPETLTLSQLRARTGLPLPVPIGPRFRRALRAGALVDSAPDVRGVLTYPQWMSQTRGLPWRPAPPR